jgi:hypothetical protein
MMERVINIIFIIASSALGVIVVGAYISKDPPAVLHALVWLLPIALGVATVLFINIAAKKPYMWKFFGWVTGLAVAVYLAKHLPLTFFAAVAVLLLIAVYVRLGEVNERLRDLYRRGEEEDANHYFDPAHRWGGLPAQRIHVATDCDHGTREFDSRKDNFALPFSSVTETA